MLLVNGKKNDLAPRTTNKKAKLVAQNVPIFTYSSTAAELTVL